MTFIAFENKWPLNIFNFLALIVTNSMISSTEMDNMNMVYHYALHLPSKTWLS